jgi:hypothetical protein
MYPITQKKRIEMAGFTPIKMIKSKDMFLKIILASYRRTNLQFESCEMHVLFFPNYFHHHCGVVLLVHQLGKAVIKRIEIGELQLI